MSKQLITIRDQLERLASECEDKRSKLLFINKENSKTKKVFTYFSGGFSIVSALLLTVGSEKVLTQEQIQILSATFAGLGGLTALCIGFALNEREVFSLSLGAARFLDLREKINNIINFYFLDIEGEDIRDSDYFASTDNSLDPVQDIIARHNYVLDKYTQLSSTYDIYTSSISKKDRKFVRFKEYKSSPPT